VLKNGEPVIQRLIDVRFTDDTDNATHVPQPLLSETSLMRAAQGNFGPKSASLNGSSAGALMPLASH
jgi:hypothetical protein